MAGPTRKPPPQFEAAAELRARGSSWDAAARELERNEKTLRDWAKKFPRQWAAALRRFERQFVREAAAESVLTLRKQLRSEDEKVVRDAAAALIRYATVRSKSVPKKPRSASAPSPEIAAVAEFVGGLDDEEVATLLRELRSAPADPGIGPVAAPPPTALAKRSE